MRGSQVHIIINADNSVFSDVYENGYIMDGHITPEYIDENGMYDGQPYMPYG